MWATLGFTIICRLFRCFLFMIQGLEEYIRQGEPQQREYGEAWEVAIGLLQVDGFKDFKISA